MRLVLTSSIALFLAAAAAQADDWPQWMGANRDNVWRETGLFEKFPKNGPSIVWRAPVAGGYAGPSVADGRVYVTDFVPDQAVESEEGESKPLAGKERIVCLNEATGDEMWNHAYAVTYGVSYPAGPRCTPNVNGGKVYTLGAEGHLFCVDAESGSVNWSKHLPEEYGTKTATWGYAGHPIVDGGRLICVVGGEGSHAVAFDKDSGRELWKSVTSSSQGYSSPTIIEFAGVRQLILFHPDAVVSLNLETGEPYWSVPYEATNGSVIMTPVRSGNLLYAAGFSHKNILIELSDKQPAATMLWQDQNKKGISPVNVQPFAENGEMYGFDQNGLLYGIEMATGIRRWQSGAPLNVERPLPSGTAFIVKNSDRFWMFNELGELLITKLSPSGYEEIDRTKVIEPTNVAFGRDVVWCAPAWANRRAYIRNGNECISVDLADPAAGE